MDNMTEAVQQFTRSIMQTEEYQDYNREKIRVKQFPELKERIDEFRRRSYEIQNSSDVAREEMDLFEEEYESLLGQPMAADFLAAELAFCRMMQEVNLKITECLDFE